MSKAFIAHASTDPGLAQYPIHSPEVLEGLAIDRSEKRAEHNTFTFSEHWLIRYYQQTLWQQHPLLFLLLVYYARQQNWSDQQWLQCRLQSLRNLLTEIELPATEINYRVLMDATELDEINQPLDLSQSKLAALYQFFKNDSASLSAEATLPQAIARLLQSLALSEAAPFSVS